MSAVEGQKPRAEFSKREAQCEVRYVDLASLRLDLEPFLRNGVLFAKGDVFPPLLEDFDFKLFLPQRPALSLRGQIVSLRGNEALIQISGWTEETWSAIESAGRGEPTQAKGPPGESAGRGGPTEPKASPVKLPPLPAGKIAGRLRNPVRLRELAALPIKPGPILQEPGEPSLIGLVRWLGANQATGVLSVEGPSCVKIRFHRGRVAWDKKQSQLLVAATWGTAKYSFEPTADAGNPMGTTSAWSLAIQLLRRVILEAKTEEFTSELPAERAPVLAERAHDFASGLSLSEAERRFCQRCLNGKTTIEELFQTRWLSELALARLLYLLHVLDFLTWIAPDKTSATTPRTTDSVRTLFEERAKGDLFVALGAHFTDSPRRIEAAYRQTLSDFGPGSAGRQTSPEYADKMIELAQKAWQVVGVRQSRNRYREQVLHVSGKTNAQLLADKAKWCKMRGELKQARELLEAAYDLHPSAEYRLSMEGNEDEEQPNTSDGDGDATAPER